MAAGLWGGLLQVGVPLPSTELSRFHGALMICGLLGTVISLERAVAAGRWWTYAAPFLSGTGALMLLADIPRAGATSFLLAAAVLLLASLSITVRQPALFTVTLSTAATCWIIGIVHWLAGYSMPVATGWWLNFLILTIAAERLELARIANPPPSSQATFLAAISLLLLGAARNELEADWAPLTGIGLLASSAWLLFHDLARRTIQSGGAVRFTAASILAGHVWLGVAGGLLLLAPLGITLVYDAAVHAVTIGFVFSMVFGHAPIILPAITGIRTQHSDLAFLPLGLLHVSVVVRVGSDLLELADVRAISGVLTVLALIGYAAVLIGSSARRSRTWHR
jgi:hypothetical protein